MTAPSYLCWHIAGVRSILHKARADLVEGGRGWFAAINLQISQQVLESGRSRSAYRRSV